MKAIVYTLSCPITNEVKYVGLTTRPLKKGLLVTYQDLPLKIVSGLITLGQTG